MTDGTYMVWIAETLYTQTSIYTIYCLYYLYLYAQNVMKNWSHKLLSIALLCFSVVAEAVIVNGLYETEVTVSNQSDGSRSSNIAKALRAVLIKLTGDSQIVSQDGVTEILRTAERYIQQFEYRNREVNGHSQLVLWARFDKSVIDHTLYQLDVPQWGRERPITLVWLALDDGVRRRLISVSDFATYIEQMNLRAQERGIVLVHPLMDLEDNQQLRSSDIWGNFHDVVRTASKRYSTDVVVTGKIESVIEGEWQGEWSVYVNQKIFPWETRSNSLDAVVIDSVDGLADILAQHYGQVGEDTQLDAVEVIVSGITDYGQYSKVLSYLSLLNSVISVEVKQVMKDSVTYILKTEVDAAVVSKAVALGRTVEEISSNNYRLIQ